MKTATVSNYLSLIKFSHTVFALPFALLGFFLAVKTTETDFDWKILGLVVLCMVFARSAAMAFNRLIDTDVDKENPRTAIREIPAGIISKTSALVFVILNSLFFIGATFFINKICFYLSPVALLVILGYSYTKRFTFLCHLILGLGLSLAPIGAWLAVTGQFAVLPILFSFSVLFWVSGFDIIYALQDEAFDKSKGLHSIPAAIGTKNALLLSSVFHFLSAGFILTAGIIGNVGIFYWVAAAVFSGLLLYQHSLVKPNDLSKVNLAFFTTNGIASIVFAGLAIADLYL
ncbi:MAG: 4-hydroxybenzoate solanesyltransferase [Bacteroidia bacterium]|nr:4-hydroxybenzoate solanesyltransferase [Bacteroidia bacterium]